jgi:hypothetical protein
MALFDYFKDLPIVAWSFDSVKEIYDIAEKKSFATYENYDDLKRDLPERIKTSISPVIFDMGMKFNLGGEQEKEKLVKTDKPIGIFDFSLASNGLYRVPEYYSIELERNSPDKFKNLGLHAGVIPPNLVQSRIINGVRNFFYSSDEQEYAVTQRQKGATALAQGDPNAKLKFATKNKKVYLKFRRQGGKVKYCEIYTLYYYTSVSGEWQYNMRHFPVLLLAEYFEKTGIKTRLYPTRFVQHETVIPAPNSFSSTGFKEFDTLTGMKLPQYEIAENSNSKSFPGSLIVAPLMVKDFGQEIDYYDFFAISDSNASVYENMAVTAYRKEFEGYYKPFGEPDWQQIQYLTGFERYKNKYAEYVKNGLWKSKEVQPEAQLFFHSMSIKNNFSNFWSGLIRRFRQIPEFLIFKQEKKQDTNDTMADEAIILEYSPLVREFFEWWMKLCALRLKTQMSIVNSKTPRKAMKEAASEVESYGGVIEMFLKSNDKKYTDEYIFETDPEKKEKIKVLSEVLLFMSTMRDDIYVNEDLVASNAADKSKPNPKMFIEAIINETTIFATGDFFATPKEDIEKRMATADYLIEELNYL